VSREVDELEQDAAAGNGLLDRRTLLKGAGALVALSAGGARAGERPAWSSRPGKPMSGYGAPSAFEAGVTRGGISAQPGAAGSGASRTPLEQLEGTITPSGLHFERHHSGVPAIDPDQHRLVVHGLVDRPLRFDLEALHRYPMVSRSYFLECSGNSGALIAPEPRQASCGELHGLVSASEWTGVPLRLLLEEAGLEKPARWVVAEGADAARMSRSVPLEKALDDALVALYQNGERLRPENGYPMRLFLPGWEGNMSVKWLHRLQVTNAPAMSRDETSKYSDLEADGSARLFTFPMAVKSVITSPSGGQRLGARGVYQISGLAWSGTGSIREVEVSADGGRSWAPASIDGPALPQHLTRFRTAWRWQGQPAVLLSRAVDSSGNRQPTRSAVLAGRGAGSFYHYNGIQAWGVDESGAVRNVYA
jgi:sulfane dehydrogenase subunit SoxC